MDEEIKREFDKIWQKIFELEKKHKKINAQKPEPITYSENLFDIEGESLTVLNFIGDKIEEKAQNIALLTLLGYREKLSAEKVLASEIRRNVAINKVPVENFATFINHLIPQSVLRVGKARSNKVSYKLTAFGLSKAKELQKTILENEQPK